MDPASRAVPGRFPRSPWWAKAACPGERRPCLENTGPGVRQKHISGSSHLRGQLTLEEPENGALKMCILLSIALGLGQ